MQTILVAQMDTSDMHLYEYALVRYMPSVERGEFVNIGLVMMCKRRKWIRTRFSVNESRIRALCGDADVKTVLEQTRGFERVAAGTSDGGEIARLDAHERFRWLTAVRSASIRTSRPHPGLAADLEKTFDRLFDELVM